MVFDERGQRRSYPGSNIGGLPSMCDLLKDWGGVCHAARARLFVGNLCQRLGVFVTAPSSDAAHNEAPRQS